MQKQQLRQTRSYGPKIHKAVKAAWASLLLVPITTGQVDITTLKVWTEALGSSTTLKVNPSNFPKGKCMPIRGLFEAAAVEGKKFLIELDQICIEGGKKK